MKTRPKKRRRRTAKPAKGLSKLQLSVRLGVSRETVHRYLARDDAPKPINRGGKRSLYDVEAFRAFYEANSPRGLDGGELRGLKKQKLETDLAAAQFELGVRQRDYIAVKEIEPAVAAFNAQLLTDLETKFVHELPPKYKRMTELEAQEANKEAIMWVLTRLKSGQAEILPAQPAEAVAP